MSDTPHCRGGGVGHSVTRAKKDFRAPMAPGSNLQPILADPKRLGVWGGTVSHSEKKINQSVIPLLAVFEKGKREIFDT